MVPGRFFQLGLYDISRFQVGFHCSRSAFMIFMIPGWFFMVQGRFSWFFIRSWFIMVQGWFSWFLKVSGGFLRFFVAPG